MIFPQTVSEPEVYVHKQKVYKNIGLIKAYADRDNVRLRPHFKTHQSLEVGSWFRDFDVHSCAVSSPSMAKYFVDGGWDDVLIALPANGGACDLYNELSEKCRLGLIGDSMELVQQLGAGLVRDVDFWIEVDAGYGRTGVKWDDEGKIVALREEVQKTSHLNYRGILVHAGNSYDCKGKEEIETFACNVKERVIAAHAIAGGEVTYGDTPTCSLGCDMSAFDELRPGNFVFYDLTQEQIGSCAREDIAVSLACPVIGSYPEQGKIVIHGGAVHLSKDSLNGHFGVAYKVDENDRWNEIGKVTKISQEHGTIEGDVRGIGVGDVVHILPVHSCLLVDCMRELVIVDA